MNEPSSSVQSVDASAPFSVWPIAMGVLPSQGLLVTVTADVPALPLAVAVMVTGPPAAIPVTSPVGETVAIEVLLVVQVGTTPVIMTLFWSRTIALSGVVPPLATVVTAGETETVVTVGATTETAAVPFCPSLVAVMVTGPPTATAVTRPAPETVATPLFDVVQVTARPVSVLPEASRSVGTSVTTAPGVSVGAAGATLTVATGGGMTVTIADPSWPSLVATMVTGPPTATAVTNPPVDTVATDVFVDDHATRRSVRLFPWASRGTAESCTVPPGEMLDEPGVTTTDATGGGGSEPPLHAASTVRQAETARRVDRRKVERKGRITDLWDLILFRERSPRGVGLSGSFTKCTLRELL